MNKTEMKAPEKIRLESHFNQLRLRQEAVTLAESGRAIVKRKLAEFETEEKMLLRERIAKGESTGDPLTDEALGAWGTNPRVLALRSLNDRLVGNDGKECMIIVPWSMDVGLHMLGYVFGFLSGNRIEIMSGTKDDFPVQFLLPLAIYRTYGLPYQITDDIHEGPVSVGIFMRSLFAVSKLLALLDKPNEGEACHFLIGKEIDEAFEKRMEIAHVVLRPEILTRLRGMLLATKKEPVLV